MESLYWVFQGSLQPTTAGASPIRLMIVYDRQANGAVCTATDVMQADSIVEMRNLGNARRFFTLVDEMIDCLGVGGPGAFIRKGYRFNLGLETEFNAGNAGTVADIQTGSVFAFCWQNGNLITASPIAQLKTRIRFVDN